MRALLPPDRVRRLAGFGRALRADGYVFRPTNPEQIASTLQSAKAAGHQVVLRGAGRSYGDAGIGAECAVLDLTRMNRITAWEAPTGMIEAEPGATLEEIWRHTLPDGWFLPVVSGTSKTTLGGALAMNIHGKNNFLRGPLGEHVRELQVLFASGELRTLTPADELFYAVISGLGLLGAIISVRLQMKKVSSGDVKVEACSCASWEEQFRAFEKYEGKAEYVVSWIDCFARGASAGRGILHAGWHEEEPPNAPSLQLAHQSLPGKIMGIVPKSSVWRFLKLLNNRFAMHMVNAAKHRAGLWKEHGKTSRQSLAEYNFLLDYVPGWERAYEPGGLIQCQFFIPSAEARHTFEQLTILQQEARLESFLAVMKRHRPDRFLLSHAVDGYSLALDFKVTGKNRARLWQLTFDMNELALKAGGRFYFAKDSTLTPAQARAFLGEELDRFRDLKRLYDPENLLTSDLARRLEI
jgi:decaprenylphospho-beta-D-ribofuranose 2-oxidase